GPMKRTVSVSVFLLAAMAACGEDSSFDGAACEQRCTADTDIALLIAGQQCADADGEAAIDVDAACEAICDARADACADGEAHTSGYTCGARPLDDDFAGTGDLCSRSE